MRTFALILVLALTAPAAAIARPGDRGDGTFAVKNGEGQIQVTATGTVLGKIDEGSVAVTDLTPGGGDLTVLGYDKRPVVKNGVTTYRGDNMRFRFAGGVYVVTVIGSGVNISAVGRGTVSGQGISDGLFSADGVKLQPAVAGFYAASFGKQQ